jgi:putative aminopeptidase FrvX
MVTKNWQRLGIVGGLELANPRVLDLPWPRLVNSILTTQLQPAGLGGAWDTKLMGLVNSTAIDRVLNGTGYNLKELSGLDGSGKLLPHFAMTAKIRAKMVYEVGRVNSPNVVALIPGSDPTLKNQYVLISAHLDHIGIGQPVNGDSIYNGAMDNASGVATLIGTARLIRSGKAPKRSILFLACTGEEEGELGSKYYAARPTVDMKNVIANINLDMYLPLFPLRTLRAYGLNESDLAAYLATAAKQNEIRVQDDPTPKRNMFIRSDQYSFIKKGIPAYSSVLGMTPAQRKKRS